ncbi:Nif3-like dinuclear metal center hexameric protein [Patulibacter sp.]|uniref:Nif3-like dinuclear metal center hexameric protein n=1 Tax=Patulibacter sp. TaxID=1912859 RepID=UPI0027276CF8|nr:Nif3-like dinuclear metal center hexameric protein [Patulibacter sp.]MDO9408772.1 Nif3-like dinuclear metal center hexameric protein [Patulibacter sp.]
MARLGDLLADLDDLLSPGSFRDYGPNGLQVPHPDGDDAEVSTVVTAVSADLEALTAAADAGADLVLVHHGLFWDGSPRELDRVAAARLRVLLAGGIALAAYHLPLDGHAEVGNNALLARELGATWVPWTGSGSPPVGVVATWEDPLPVGELLERVAAATQPRPLHFPGGPDAVRRLAIVSGAAAGMVADAAADGLDGLLTGEPREQTRGLAREHGIHAICAGHHATETGGVQALGERLAGRFGVTHRWVDTANPI